MLGQSNTKNNPSSAYCMYFLFSSLSPAWSQVSCLKEKNRPCYQVYMYYSMPSPVYMGKQSGKWQESTSGSVCWKEVGQQWHQRRCESKQSLLVCLVQIRIVFSEEPIPRKSFMTPTQQQQHGEQRQLRGELLWICADRKTQLWRNLCCPGGIPQKRLSSEALGLFHSVLSSINFCALQPCGFGLIFT